MMHVFFGKCVSSVLLTMILTLSAVGVTAQSDYLSPVDLVADADSGMVYVAEATAGQVACFDTASGKVTRTINLTGLLSGVVLDAKTSTLYVTQWTPDGIVHVVNAKTGRVTGKIKTGHSPTAPVLSADGKTLYICNQFDNTVSVIDTASKKTTKIIPAAREPIAAALSPNGKTLLVGNHLPAGAANGDYTAAVVTVIDTATNKAIDHITLVNGTMNVKDIAVSPDGKFAYFTCVLARYQVPTSQLSRGWVATNGIGVIDVASKKLVNTVLIDNVDNGAANPWGITCSKDGKSIFASISGTNEVSVIDRLGLHAKLDKAAAGQKVSDVTDSAEDVPNDLSFITDLQRRIPLKGINPRGIASINNTIFAAEYFSESLAIVTLNGKAAPKARSIALGEVKPMTPVREGEMLFNSADLCFQNWLSCATCHPGEARMDGLNWDLLNDGLGNPRSTKSMLIAHETAPAMITGVRARAEIAVRAGIRHIQFAKSTKAQAESLDDYLKSLKPVPSPYLVNGQLSAAAKRGKKVFEDAMCSMCHSGKYYTDMEKHQVGTAAPGEEDIAYDTPTLIEIWRTGPYLQDGRAATMMEVLTTYNKNDEHGTTSDLSEKELNDLVEYIMSL